MPERSRRDVALLTAGLSVSTVGDSAALVAILLELRAAGVGWVSAALGADLLPFILFASLSGRIVDRVDNRRLLVIALALQGAVVLPLAFVREPLAVVVLVFAVASFSTVVRPATNAMVPVLAGEGRAPSAYAWVSTGTSIGFTAGYAAGGLLTAAFGVKGALLADTATFAVLAVTCSRLSATRSGGSSPDEGPRLGGMAILWRNTVLRWSVLVTAVAVACAVIDNVAAPFRFVDQLHTSSTGYGFYLAVWGAGSLVGAQIPRRIGVALMPAALAAGNAISGLGIFGIGLAPTLGIALVASAIGGVGNGIANVAIAALVSGRVDESERGRAFASVSALIQTGVGVGTVAGAPLVAVFGAGHSMAGAGALTVVIGGATALWTFAHGQQQDGSSTRHSAPSASRRAR
ncbi:MAG TPA: MFS transporter [Mycobacteriales bacterium]|nr:MFS transporter [Mycobacteriales bacterium]